MLSEFKFEGTPIVFDDAHLAEPSEPRMLLVAPQYSAMFERIWSGWKLWIETKGKRGTKPPHASKE